MTLKSSGTRRESIDNLAQHLGTDRGRLAFVGILRLENRGRFLEARLAAGRFFLDRLHFLQDQLEAHLEFRFQAGGFVVTQRASLDQLFLVELGHRRARSGFPRKDRAG